MNILEYGYYDLASDEIETKDNIKKAILYNPSVVSILPYYTKSIKPLLTPNIRLSTIIDYPFGLTDTDSRIKSVETTIKNDSDIIELICPTHLLCNRKYDKFRKELEIVSGLCQQSSIELRYILEYKLFTPELLYKVSHILQEFNINTICPSSNYLMDTISDNILASMLISHKNPKINIIVNGSAWTDEHIDLILSNTKIYGYRTSNIYTLAKIVKKSQNS
jgi:deoxyribose-phosphate aldolase